MSSYKKLSKTLKQSSKALQHALHEATEELCDLIFALHDAYRKEYSAQLEERKLEENPLMPSLGASEELGPEDRDFPGYYYPRWHAPYIHGDGTVGDFLDVIEARHCHADYSFEELERKLPELKAWELLLVWKYELQVRPLRASIRQLDLMIEEMFEKSYFPLPEQLPRVDNVLVRENPARA